MYRPNRRNREGPYRWVSTVEGSPLISKLIKIKNIVYIKRTSLNFRTIDIFVVDTLKKVGHPDMRILTDAAWDFWAPILDLKHGICNQTEVEDEYKKPGPYKRPVIMTLFIAGDIIAIISGVCFIWMKYLMRRKFAHKTGLKEKVFFTRVSAG